MPTLKGTEVSLSYVQCFLFLVSSPVMSLFHSLWLDTVWTDLVFNQLSTVLTNVECEELHYETSFHHTVLLTSKTIKHIKDSKPELADAVSQIHPFRTYVVAASEAKGEVID